MKFEVIGYDFGRNDITKETALYKSELIDIFGSEESAAANLKKKEDILAKYGEWPCSESTHEEREFYLTVEKAENLAWFRAFENWVHKPGERGEYFEYQFSDYN